MAASFVQDAHNSGSVVSSLDVAINGVTSGNKLILGVSAWHAAGTGLPTGVSSSPALTWTLDQAGGEAHVGDVNDHQQVSIWSALADASDDFTVTVTWPNERVYAHATVAEFSGVAAADVSASNTGDESDNTPTSGMTAAAAQVDSLVIGVLGVTTDSPDDDPVGIDTPTGYTNIEIDQGAFTICAHSMDYRVPTTADPREVEWGTLVTFTGNIGWSAAVVVYRGETGGVGGLLSQTLGAVSVSADSDLPIKGAVSGGVG